MDVSLQAYRRGLPRTSFFLLSLPLVIKIFEIHRGQRPHRALHLLKQKLKSGTP